jgi:predicted transcriptional regulator
MIFMSTFTNEDNLMNSELKELNISVRDKLYSQYENLVSELQRKYDTIRERVREKSKDNKKLKSIYKQYKNELKETEKDKKRTIEYLEDLKSYLTLMEDKIMKNIHEHKKEYINNNYLLENIQIQRKRIDDEIRELMNN